MRRPGRASRLSRLLAAFGTGTTARRDYPPLNGHVPMPDGPGPLAAPWARCGCELVWRPCVIHDPAWPAEMERMVRGDSEPA